MLKQKKSILLLAAFSLVPLMLSGGAVADKPHWAEKGKHHSTYDAKYDKKKYKKRSGSKRFHKRDRSAIYDYYGQTTGGKHCPPGLAKKNNGCLPPGQYKKWQKGQALPQHVRYYDLPSELRRRLSHPYDGYGYVRVDNDVLLINLATNIVVDAIENILR
ncbi:MAG TPA: RcnB family protein [Alcanivoracaceae bacterium]|nr:RcnB family protein [Alcanivoracaceae bacterium]